MRKMTHVLSFLLFVSTYSTDVKAQDFQLPNNIVLVAKEDYAPYEKTVIAAADWLQATPVKTGDEKRKEVSAFIVQWLSGSPTVNMDLGPALMKLNEKNSFVLIMMMAGYSRYVLQNNYATDKTKAYTAGMKAVLAVYANGGDIKKDKTLDKAATADKEGKLSEWINSNIIGK